MSRQHLGWCNNLKFDPSDVAESRNIFRNVDDTLSYGYPYLYQHILVTKAYIFFKPPLVTPFRKEDFSIIFPAFIN